MTVFLATHNMKEAGQLCHRVAIIDLGRLVAIDTPAALRARVHARRSVEVRFAEAGPRPAAFVPELAELEVAIFADGFRAFTPEPRPLTQLIASRATEQRLRIERILRRFLPAGRRS